MRKLHCLAAYFLRPPLFRPRPLKSWPFELRHHKICNAYVSVHELINEVQKGTLKENALLPHPEQTNYDLDAVRPKHFHQLMSLLYHQVSFCVMYWCPVRTCIHLIYQIMQYLREICIFVLYLVTLVVVVCTLHDLKMLRNPARC